MNRSFHVAILYSCTVLGCTPFEVFYGRVSNSELHPVLSTINSDLSESDGGESSLSVSLCIHNIMYNQNYNNENRMLLMIMLI